MHKFLLIVNSISLFFILNFCSNGVEIRNDYYPDGTLKRTYEVQNGNIHGRFVEYYPSGEMQYSLQYVNDSVEGMVCEFYKTGILKSAVNISKDIEHGDYVYFDKKGNIKQTGRNQHGKRVGFHNLYRDGCMIQSRQFLNIEGKTVVNQAYNWDEFGNLLINLSQFHSFLSPPNVPSYDELYSLDTHYVDSLIHLHLILNTTSHGDDSWFDVKFVYGDYNEDFSLDEGIKLDTIDFKGTHLLLDFLFNRVGKHALRGKIINSCLLDGEMKEDVLFVEKKYNIIEKK